MLIIYNLVLIQYRYFGMDMDAVCVCRIPVCGGSSDSSLVIPTQTYKYIQGKTDTMFLKCSSL